MSIAAARTIPTPRYGSPGEIAAHAGLSAKTIRRLIASGAVPSYRVGRRVLVPFGAIDRFIQGRRHPIMAIAPNPVSPPRSFDARGRALPMTAEEIRRRNEEAIRGLEALDDMGDDDEQRETLDALLKALDEDPL